MLLSATKVLQNNHSWLRRTEFLERIENMTKEDIVRMAKWSGWNAQEVDCFFYEIESFFTHVAEYERELCAKVCDERAQTKSLSNHRRCDADQLARAIRSRDQP